MLDPLYFLARVHCTSHTIWPTEMDLRPFALTDELRKEIHLAVERPFR